MTQRHVMENALSGCVNHEYSAKALSSNYSNVIEDKCSLEILQFLECASRKKDLDTCKSFP